MVRSAEPRPRGPLQDKRCFLFHENNEGNNYEEEKERGLMKYRVARELARPASGHTRGCSVAPCSDKQNDMQVPPTT